MPRRRTNTPRVRSAARRNIRKAQLSRVRTRVVRSLATLRPKRTSTPLRSRAR